MTGIVLAIYSSFFLALSQGTLKRSYREFPASIAFAFDAVLAVLIWIPLALILGVNIDSLIPALPYALASAILSEALYFYALTKGQLSITSILLGSYAIYTVLFSYLFNGERLLAWQLVSVMITIIGTLIVYLPSKFSRQELKKMGAVVWPLLAAVGIGLSDSLSKHFINQSNDYSFLLVLALIQIPVALVYLRMEGERIGKVWEDLRTNAGRYKQAIAGSFFNVIGTGFLWMSFSFTLASIASPITATSGAIVVLLATFLLDENLNWRSILGLVMVLGGVIGISLTN